MMRLSLNTQQKRNPWLDLRRRGARWCGKICHHIFIWTVNGDKRHTLRLILLWFGLLLYFLELIE